MLILHGSLHPTKFKAHKAAVRVVCNPCLRYVRQTTGYLPEAGDARRRPFRAFGPHPKTKQVGEILGDGSDLETQQDRSSVWKFRGT